MFAALVAKTWVVFPDIFSNNVPQKVVFKFKAIENNFQKLKVTLVAFAYKNPTWYLYNIWLSVQEN